MNLPRNKAQNIERLGFPIMIAGMAILTSVGCDREEIVADSAPEAIGCTITRLPSQPGSIVLELALQNNHDFEIRIPRTEIVTDTLMRRMFSVARNGDQLQFHGPIGLYRVSSDADLVTLRPGETVRGQRKLNRDYDLNRRGPYEVTLAHKYLTMTSGSIEELHVQPIACNQLTVTVTEPALPPAIEEHVSGLSEFADCSASQESVTLLAESYARTSGYWGLVFEFPRGAASNLYVRWFGTHDSDRADTVEENMDEVHDALANGISDGDDYECEDEEECDGAVAFVVQPIPQVVHLCPTFFTLPLTGRFSKAETIIHELSHWHGSTDDNASGVSASLSLAISDPDDAVDNADSYAFFCADALTDYTAMLMPAIAP
jgi:hypothetical protein